MGPEVRDVELWVLTRTALLGIPYCGLENICLKPVGSVSVPCSPLYICNFAIFFHFSRSALCGRIGSDPGDVVSTKISHIQYWGQVLRDGTGAGS